MFGRDRAGGREGKKSLRKTKIALVEQKKGKGLNLNDKTLKSEPLPKFSSLLKENKSRILIDSTCNLVSRRFESDTQRVIQRAISEGIVVVVASNDCQKQEEIEVLCAQYPGILYAMVGIHPDNIKRTNKLFEQKQDTLKAAALKPEAAAIITGLDLSRDIATHYPQEKFLSDHLILASEVNLPVVLVDLGSFSTTYLFSLKFIVFFLCN